MENNTLKVVFRKWHNVIIAIFPEIPGTEDPYTCKCYQHMVPHAVCDPYTVMRESVPAKKLLYWDLLKELEMSGTKVVVLDKLKPEHVEVRKSILSKEGFDTYHWVHASYRDKYGPPFFRIASIFKTTTLDNFKYGLVGDTNTRQIPRTEHIGAFPSFNVVRRFLISEHRLTEDQEAWIINSNSGENQIEVTQHEDDDENLVTIKDQAWTLFKQNRAVLYQAVYCIAVEMTRSYFPTTKELHEITGLQVAK